MVSEGDQTIETKPEMAQTIELVDKNIYKVIITAFYMFKKLEERTQIK